MALRSKSLFLFGFSVTAGNRSIDFKTSPGGIERQATLSLGYYTLGGLLDEVVRAMTAADPANTFTASANRTFAGNTENRVFISTSATFFSLLFGTGSRSASSVAPLIGFNPVDYTGLTSYGGNHSAGTALIPELYGYNYLGPDFMRTNFGSVNIAADGTKEAIVFSIQRFFQVEFRYEPEDKVIAEWAPFFTWMIQQRPLEFTPNITSPTVFYDATLESSSSDMKGLSYAMKEMLPQFPFLYTTGNMKFRQKIPPTGFL